VQDWPHHKPAAKLAAVQMVLDMAGFKAVATCWPAFGGMWPKTCDGPDGVEATAWLQELTNTLPRGEATLEIRHIRRALDTRIAEREGRLT
jgi:hypothetical protein